MLRNLGWYLSLFLITALFLGIATGQLLGQPVFLLIVESDSMSPTLEPGDATIVVPDFATTRSYGTNDIIVFEDVTFDEARPTTHRVVDKTDEGLITQGDGNPVTDQAGQEPPVTRDRVLGYVPTRGESPIIIPFVGSVVLTIQGISSGNPMLLIVAGAAIAAIGIVSSALGSQRYNRDIPNKRQLHPLAVAAIAVIILIIISTAVMVLPTGPQGRAIQVVNGPPQEDGVYETGVTDNITYEFNNSGYLPVLVLLESETEVANPPPDGIVVGPQDATRWKIPITVPSDPGVYQIALSEYRYLAVIPPSLIVLLHEFHPLAALAVINIIIGFVTTCIILISFGVSPSRITTETSKMPLTVRIKRKIRAILGQ